jgi:hypothetical protein
MIIQHLPGLGEENCLYSKIKRNPKKIRESLKEERE